MSSRTTCKNWEYFISLAIVILLSVLIILVGGALIGTKGLNLGVDYKAGTDISVVSEKEITKKDIDKKPVSADSGKDVSDSSAEQNNSAVKNDWYSVFYYIWRWRKITLPWMATSSAL